MNHCLQKMCRMLNTDDLLTALGAGSGVVACDSSGMGGGVITFAFDSLGRGRGVKVGHEGPVEPKGY
jgi:hypothetical protein